MMDEISWFKFLEWQAYSELEPFDEWRSDVRAAQITVAIKNIFAKHPRSISDEIIEFGVEKPKRFTQTQTIEEQKGIARMIALAFGGK